MKDKHVLIAQCAAERFGPQVPGPGGSGRCGRSGGNGSGRAAPAPAMTGRPTAPRSEVHVTVHRPGQVVALDTTPLPVKVRDGVFGEPVSAHLTLALDLFTHSAVAFGS